MGELLPDSHWASYALGLGERIRALRIMRGLSQTRLAELAGVSRSLVSNIERNDYNERAADPTLSTLYRIARALHVPPAMLLPGSLDDVDDAYVLQGPDAKVKAIMFQWPRSPYDTARFSTAYLQPGAPRGTPVFSVAEQIQHCTENAVPKKQCASSVATTPA